MESVNNMVIISTTELNEIAINANRRGWYGKVVTGVKYSPPQQATDMRGMHLLQEYVPQSIDDYIP